MEVSGQSWMVDWGKQPTLSLNRRLDGSGSWPGHFGKINHLLLLGNET